MERKILTKEKIHHPRKSDYYATRYLETYDYYLEDGKEVKHGERSISGWKLLVEENYIDGEQVGSATLYRW